MISAIYARKSNDQTGTDADAKSVARQITDARTFAASKGWTVADAHVYIETIRNGPPFQVLIVRDASRLSRRDGDVAFAS